MGSSVSLLSLPGHVHSGLKAYATSLCSFQELDYGQKWWMIPIHIIPGIIIQPFASISEGLAAIWAMSSEDFGKFEVIQKR